MIGVVIVRNAIAIRVRTERAARALDIVVNAIHITIAGTRAGIIGVEIVGNAIAIAIIIRGIAVVIEVFIGCEDAIAIVVRIQVIRYGVAVGIHR